MTNRTRRLLLLATIAAGASVGLAPVATATTAAGTPQPRLNASGGRGACVAVQDVGGWCVVNPFDDLPKLPPLP
jgi:hypothetical protein